MGKRHELGKLRGREHRDELAGRDELASHDEPAVCGRQEHRDELVDHDEPAVCGKQVLRDELVDHGKLAACDPWALHLGVLEGIRNQLAAFILFY